MAWPTVNFALKFMAYTLVPNVRYLEGPGFDLRVRGRQYSGLSLISSAYQYTDVWMKTQQEIFFLISPLTLNLLAPTTVGARINP